MAHLIPSALIMMGGFLMLGIGMALPNWAEVWLLHGLGYIIAIAGMLGLVFSLLPWSIKVKL